MFPCLLPRLRVVSSICWGRGPQGSLHQGIVPPNSSSISLLLYEGSCVWELIFLIQVNSLLRRGTCRAKVLHWIWRWVHNHRTRNPSWSELRYLSGFSESYGNTVAYFGAYQSYWFFTNLTVCIWTFGVASEGMKNTFFVNKQILPLRLIKLL